MAAVPIEIRGTLYDLQSKSSRQVFLAGNMVRSDLSIGGGPIVPPNGGTPPIDPPTEPPPGGGDKPPPEGSGGWGFVAEWSRWGYFPGPSEAGPKLNI